MRPLLHASSVALFVLVLSACGGPTAPVGGEEPEPERLDLSGLWSVTGPVASGEEEVTYGFDSEVGGRATILARSTASGVTSCDEADYGLLADESLYLDGQTYGIADATAGSFDLTYGGNVVATFTRVEGEAPVEPCSDVSASSVTRLEEYPNLDSKLHFLAGELIFTGDGWEPSIMAYAVGEPPSSARVVATLQARYQTVVAAQDADTLYVAEFAGGVDTLGSFDPADPAAFDPFTLQTTDGGHLFIRAAYWHASERRLKVAASTNEGEYLLLTVDPATETVEAQETLLPGASIVDLTVANGELLAALNDGSTIVRVGDDGLAEETLAVHGHHGSIQGIAANGPTIYLLTAFAGDAAIYTFTSSR